MATKTAKLKVKKENVVDVFEVLTAFDMNAKEAWNEYSDEEKKHITFFIINRWLSSVNSCDQETVEHYVIAVNEFFNKHFFSLSKHPELLWKLACLCSYDGTAKNHKWITTKKIATKKETFLQDLFPNTKYDDIVTLAKITTDEQIKEHCKDLGWDSTEISKIRF
jgi:hypothetical protein